MMPSISRPAARRPFELLEPAVALRDMLREHRADGHIAALAGARIGGTEAHALPAAELDELVAELEPITATLVAAGSQ